MFFFAPFPYIFVSLYRKVSHATYSEILQKYDKTSLFQLCNGVVIFPEFTIETITTSHGSSDVKNISRCSIQPGKQPHLQHYLSMLGWVIFWVTGWIPRCVIWGRMWGSWLVLLLLDNSWMLFVQTLKGYIIKVPPTLSSLVTKFLSKFIIKNLTNKYIQIYH